MASANTRWFKWLSPLHNRICIQLLIKLQTSITLLLMADGSNKWTFSTFKQNGFGQYMVWYQMNLTWYVLNSRERGKH